MVLSSNESQPEQRVRNLQSNPQSFVSNSVKACHNPVQITEQLLAMLTVISMVERLLSELLSTITQSVRNMLK